MAQRRFHYDLAFEHYLRSKRIPHVVVDEARKPPQGPADLKNFDFVVYAESGENLLIDVKGRKHGGRHARRLDSWVTREDVTDLERWQAVFGEGFRAALVFLYWCERQPPDALFHEVFSFRGRWYAVVAVTIDDYRRHMRSRSPRWDTVDLSAEAFDRVSQPLMRLL